MKTAVVLPCVLFVSILVGCRLRDDIFEYPQTWSVVAGRGSIAHDSVIVSVTNATTHFVIVQIYPNWGPKDVLSASWCLFVPQDYVMIVMTNSCIGLGPGSNRLVRIDEPSYYKKGGVAAVHREISPEETKSHRCMQTVNPQTEGVEDFRHHEFGGSFKQVAPEVFDPKSETDRMILIGNNDIYQNVPANQTTGDDVQ